MNPPIEKPTVLLLINLTHQQLKQWQAAKQTFLLAGAGEEQVGYCQAKIDQLVAEIAQLSDWRS